MSNVPECIYIKLYPFGGRDGSEQLLIEIPYDRLHESYRSMAFATAYLAGQDRLFPLMNHRDFNTFFHIEIKWF